jgi:hypothetical protein
VKTQEKIAVNRDVLEQLLDIARDGEAQCVPYSKDQQVFAERAAERSKRKCADIIEVLLLILTGEEVTLSVRDDEQDDE